MTTSEALGLARSPVVREGDVVHEDGTPIEMPRPKPHPRKPMSMCTLRSRGETCITLDGLGREVLSKSGPPGDLHWCVGPNVMLPPKPLEWEHEDGAPLDLSDYVLGADGRVLGKATEGGVKLIVGTVPPVPSVTSALKPQPPHVHVVPGTIGKMHVTCSITTSDRSVMEKAAEVASKDLDRLLDDDTRWVEPVTSRPSMPTVEELARAIFETDPEVVKLVATKADATVVERHGSGTRLQYEGRPWSITWQVEGFDQGRIDRTMATAWRINDGGHRERCMTRAAEILAKLGGRR